MVKYIGLQKSPIKSVLYSQFRLTRLTVIANGVALGEKL